MFSFSRGLVLLCLLYSECAFSAASLKDVAWQEIFSAKLEQLLKEPSQLLPERDKAALKSLYQARNYHPLWSSEAGLLNRAYELFHVTSHAEDEGLKPSDYYTDEIRNYWGTKQLEDLVYLELLLSAALYRYSDHVYSGRYDPAEMDVDWHIENEALDADKLFAEVAKEKSIVKKLQQLPPSHSGYLSLKKQLARFREFEKQGGWTPFKRGPTLELGVQHKQIVQLRQRLQKTGDLIESPWRYMDIFDYELHEAVKRYQQRHGLMADGRVGPVTRASLNIPVAEKIRQILINMERWRWMPRYLGKRYLIVNMTGFELYLIEKESPILSMPVIIGRSYRSTPSFSGVLSYLEYNPYWTIPENMAINDFVPRQINDAAFFAKKDIKLFRGWGDNAREVDPQSVDWRQLDMAHFPYWLRQEPGTKNALGRIKFLFSNPYEVYLHGTPDSHLFDRVVRTFSSGCIRVKDPVRLAAYLLNDGSSQMVEEVLANIQLGTTQGVDLLNAAPIYLVYWTAWADAAGEVNFRSDYYGRDTLLNRAFDYF